MRRSLGSLVAAAAVALAFAAPASAASSITDRLSPAATSIEITSLPAGTEHVGLAIMPSYTSSGSAVKYVVIPVSQKTYTPPAADPVVDAQAFTGPRAGTGHPIGNWAGRLKTVPGGESQAEKERREREAREKAEREARERAEREARERAEREQHEREEREHLEEPPREEPPSAFLPGLNAGYWGSGELTDLKTLRVKVVRLDTPTSTDAWEALGLKVIADMSGPYSSSGVSGVNVSSYIARDVTLVKKDPRLYALETLNEPSGDWFWGANSRSQANVEAYGRLVVAVHEALVREFGAARPLQLCAADGEWGNGWYKIPGALAACDMLVDHPYGGTGNRETARLGNRSQVERTHAATGKPIAATEVGFPTIHSTGDSLQYTEKEQAWSIYHFAEWAARTGYVPVVNFYGYRDSSNGAGYGVERNNGSHKPAWEALNELALGQPCTVC